MLLIDNRIINNTVINISDMLVHVKRSAIDKSVKFYQ